MTPDLLKQIKANCEQAEGRIAHLYLDTKGNVTVGIGHLVPSSGHAVNLELNPESAVASDYAAVRTAKPGMLASAYEPLCQSRMYPQDIDALLDDDLGQCHVDLNKRINIEPFPDPAQAAMLDMAFNLGVSGLMKFSKLCSAALSGDWATAAAECHRKGISEERNHWTEQMFQRAAIID